jgi:hypothetical protein
MNDRATTIRGLIAAQPAPTGGVVDHLRCVCQAAAEALSASGTGISVLTDDGTRGVYAASDPLSEHVEELQFLLGEGPCLDAFDGRRPVLIADLAGEAMTRWPVYASEAHDRGVRAVFAFPLQIGAARLGVFDVFRDHAAFPNSIWPTRSASRTSRSRRCSTDRETAPAHPAGRQMTA